MKTTTTTIATHQPAANPRRSSITRTAIRQCKQAPATALALLTALLTLCAAPAARALTWDTVSGDNPTITDGSGNWNTTAGNLVWNNNANPNVIWSQTSTTVGSQAAVFGSGTDGTVDQWTVTLASQMAATSLTFTNTGYKITGSTLQVATSATVDGTITVASNKTATINSIIGYANNAAAVITVNSGGTLNLGGGAGNSQYSFVGGGIVNLTAGTYSANIGRVNVPTFNQRGGTFNITPGNLNGYDIGRDAGQSVSYTLTNATLTANGNASTATVVASYLALGRNLVTSTDYTPYTNTLTVQDGATVNIGTTASRAGELRIGASTNASGKFDVQGGAVTIGTGATANKIYFFKAGSSAGYTATMTQSGGTVTANGIQFCEVPATLDLASSATLQLSGGSLYVGAQGVTLGAGASALPVTIQLQGGTLGANQDWSSSLDMKLGTTGGGPTIRAQNSASTARNITLSGILSDDTAVNGTLTKTGSGTLTLSGDSANTFTGPTLVSAGTLDLGKASAVSSSSSVTIASGAALALSISSSTVPNLTFTNTGTLSFDVAGGFSLTVSGTDGVTNSGAAGSVTINITGSAPANGTYTLIAYSGALRGIGFSAYVLGSTPAGKTYALNDTGSAVQLIVSDSYFWTGAQSSEWSTNTIAGSKNWAQGQFGSPVDYTNGQAVVFDDTATGYTVDITVADVTPVNVYFNNNGGTPYTLQGSKAIAGTTPLTKAGWQTLTILNTNTYTGGTTISAGTLQLGDGTSGNDGTIASSPTVANNGELVYNRFGTNSYGGVISGSGLVTKSGNGTQTLTGTNTYTGATTVNAGTLEIGGSGRMGNGTYSGAISVASDATFAFNSTLGGTLSGSITGSGTFLKANTAQVNLNNAGNSISTIRVHQGVISFDAGLNTGCTGDAGTTIYLGDTNGFADALINFFGGGNKTMTTKTAYIVQSGSSGTKTIRGVSAITTTDNTPITLNDNLTITNVSGGTLAFGGIISGTNGITKTGSGQLTLAGANTFNGGVTIKNGTVNSTTTQFTLGTGKVVMGGAGSSGATYITGQANTNAFTINAPDSGSIIIGANGASSGFTLSGPVTLNGDLMIQSFSGSPGANTARPILDGGITGTGNLLLNNLGNNTNTITLGGNPINHAGSITAQGGSVGSNVITAQIGANVTGVTQNSATCPLILSATNTYTGPTTVNAGTMVIQVASLAASSTVSVAAGAVLQLDFTTTNVVAGFSTNGVSLPAGVYNAGNVAPFIAGLGTLEVAAAGPSGPATLTNSVSGSTLTLTWPAGEFWRLEGQTNSLSSGLNPATNAWFTVPGGVDGSNSIPINPANPTVFYRLVYP